MIDYFNLDSDEFFNLTPEERKDIIRIGANFLLREVVDRAKQMDIKPSILLNRTLAQMEGDIERLKQEEEYEMCYYFNEIFWEVNNILNDKQEEN